MGGLFEKKELIYTIYQEKSFSRAAQKLFISQPSLSLMVKKLEDQIGSPLFDRSCKPIRLTQTGQQYIAAVEQIMQIEGDYETYLQAMQNLEAGHLRIGSNQLLSSLVLPRYISRFCQEHPGIQLALTDANSITLENELSAGQLDLVIDNHKLSERFFERKRLATEHLLLAVPAAFLQTELAQNYRLSYEDIIQGRHLKHAPAVPLDIFSDVPFILMNRDNDLRTQTNAIFQEAVFSPKVLFELDRLTTLFAYIETGTAASVVSDTLVRNSHIRNVENTCFYPLSGTHGRRGIYVSFKRNRPCTAAMLTFMDSLENLR